MPNPEECCFTQSHEWVCLAGGLAAVGISDHAQKEITDVVYVELPKPGKKMRKAEACAIVESVKAAFDIYAPVSGEIAEVNQEIVQNPALVNQSPYEKGWFFKIKPEDLKELDSLMTHSQYQEFIKKG